MRLSPRHFSDDFGKGSLLGVAPDLGRPTRACARGGMNTTGSNLSSSSVTLCSPAVSGFMLSLFSYKISLLGYRGVPPRLAPASEC